MVRSFSDLMSAALRVRCESAAQSTDMAAPTAHTPRPMMAMPICSRFIESSTTPPMM